MANYDFDRDELLRSIVSTIEYGISIVNVSSERMKRNTRFRTTKNFASISQISKDLGVLVYFNDMAQSSNPDYDFIVNQVCDCIRRIEKCNTSLCFRC